MNKLEELHRLLRGNYATQWNEDTDLACKFALESALKDCGMERLETAVKATIELETFFQASAIRKHIPSIELPPDHPSRQRCSECKDTYPFRLEYREGAKMPTAVRCDHRKESA